MTNDYFNHDKNEVPASTRPLEAHINNIGDEVEAAFDKLPNFDFFKNGIENYDPDPVDDSESDSGGCAAYVVTLPGTVALTDGLHFCFAVPYASCVVAAVNVNGLGIKEIVNVDGSALVAGALPADSKACLTYDSGTDKFMLTTATPANDGPALIVKENGVEISTNVESITIVGAEDSSVVVTGGENISINVAPITVLANFTMELVPEDFVATCTVFMNGEFTVDWGDGSPIAYDNENASAVPTGNITVVGGTGSTWPRLITNTFTSMDIQGIGLVTFFLLTCQNMSKLTSFSCVASPNVTNFNSAWENCTGLTSFPFFNTSGCTDVSDAWEGCTGLTSFPALDLSNCTDLGDAWYGCSALTAFPAIDCSAATEFKNTWRGCTAMTSFLVDDYTAGETFTDCWRDCSALAGQFPVSTFPAAVTMERAFYNCGALTGNWPATDVFDGATVTNVDQMYVLCAGITQTWPGSGFPNQLTGADSLWNQCAMTSFPSGFDLNNVVSLKNTWANNSLTSFPLLDFTSVTNLQGAFSTNPFTTFPAIVASACTSFLATWQSCDSMTSFGAIDCSAGTNFQATWKGCDALTGDFPSLDFGAGTNFDETFMDTTFSSIGDINSVNGTSFVNMFRNNGNLVCLTGIDTTSTISSNLFMFTGCTSLNNPNTAEENLIKGTGGSDYTNAGSCPP